MAAVAGQPRQVSVLGTDLGKNFCCGVLDYSFDRRALQHQTSNACLAWNCGDPAPKCQWQCTVWQSRLQAPMQEGIFVYHCIVKDHALPQAILPPQPRSNRRPLQAKQSLLQSYFCFVYFYLAKPLEYKFRYSEKKKRKGSI